MNKLIMEIYEAHIEGIRITDMAVVIFKWNDEVEEIKMKMELALRLKQIFDRAG